MTTWYVHRRPDNSIASRHADPMPGYAEEELAEDSADMLAWAGQHLAPPVPARVTAGSFIRALYEVDRIVQVKAAVAAAGGIAEDLWHHASTFVRADPLVSQIGAAIGMDAAAIDDLFRRADAHDQELGNG